MRIAGRRSVRRAVLNRVDRTTRPHRSDRALLEGALPLVADGVDALVARVCATPAIPERDRRRRNSRQLLPSDLTRLLANPDGYVCHRTDREDVGTCRVPPAIGVRATPGVRGDDHDGRFGVVFPRGAWPFSMPHESSAEAVGWYVREDLEEAMRG